MLRVEARVRLGSLGLEAAVEVPAGGCLALTGPSGAGKTTLLRIVAGLLAPDEGRVACGGEEWLDTGRRFSLAPERRRCGFVFQDYALFGHMRVWQNVAYGMRGAPRRARRERARALLARLGGEELSDRRPPTLSGGERQRVALARALAIRPAALLLDEPLAALDVTARARAATELGAVLRSAGVPALLVSHDFMQAAVLADEVAVLDRGRIIQRGDPAELAARPATAFVADLTGAVVLTGHACPGIGGLTSVQLDGGGVVTSTQSGTGRVAVSLFPWEIALDGYDSPPRGSAQNRLAADVVSVTTVGSRVRVGMVAGQPLTAEVTEAAVRDLGLRPGLRVIASFKATATRLIAL